MPLVKTNSMAEPKKDSGTTLPESFFITGALGIEPSSGVLETLILPMNYAPKSLAFLLYYTKLKKSIIIFYK